MRVFRASPPTTLFIHCGCLQVNNSTLSLQMFSPRRAAARCATASVQLGNNCSDPQLPQTTEACKIASYVRTSLRYRSICWQSSQVQVCCSCCLRSRANKNRICTSLIPVASSVPPSTLARRSPADGSSPKWDIDNSDSAPFGSNVPRRPGHRNPGSSPACKPHTRSGCSPRRHSG